MMSKWEITYRLPTMGTRYLTKVVDAQYQWEAKRLFEAEVPSAKICGNPRRLPFT